MGNIKNGRKVRVGEIWSFTEEWQPMLGRNSGRFCRTYKDMS